MPKSKPKTKKKTPAKSKTIKPSRLTHGWHPHDGQWVWGVVFLILITMSGCVGVYVVKQHDAFWGEIGSGELNNHEFVSKSNIKNMAHRITGIKTNKDEWSSLSSEFLNYQINYPSGWHVSVSENGNDAIVSSVILNDQPMIFDVDQTMPIHLMIDDLVLNSAETFESIIEEDQNDFVSIELEETIITSTNKEVYKLFGVVESDNLEIQAVNYYLPYSDKSGRSHIIKIYTPWDGGTKDFEMIERIAVGVSV